MPRLAEPSGVPALTGTDRLAEDARFGRGAVVPGTAGFAPERDRSTGFGMPSPRYTVTVGKLPVILAA